MSTLKLKTVSGGSVSLTPADTASDLTYTVLPDGDSGGSALVGYLPAGTGAVATTVQTKLRESVSVLDFGAVGDGVTDDTPAFNAAILAVFNAGGGNVTIPPSVSHYKINGCVYVKKGVNILAYGATVKRYHAKEIANQAFQLDGNNIIAGMTYDGNATGIADPSNFVLYHDFNCGATLGGADEFFKFESCTFIDSPGSFILSSSGVRDLMVTGNKFYDYLDHCVYVGGYSYSIGDPQNVTITGNTFRGNASITREAIKSRNGLDGLLVSGNSFFLPAGRCVTVDTGDVSEANRKATRVDVVGNNAICQTFVQNTGSFDGGDGSLCVSDIRITGNVVDCNYLFQNGTNSWTQVSSFIGAFDTLTISDNTVKGGMVFVFGVKNRPVRVGSGAAATAVLTANAVTSITVDAGGSGYTHTPVIALRDATNSGFGAIAKATVSGGVVTGFTVINGGTGYTTAPTVYFESYGVQSVSVVNNTFLPREYVTNVSPLPVCIFGDVAHTEIAGNRWDAITSNYTGVYSPLLPFPVSASGLSRAALTTGILNSSPSKPRVFVIKDNYSNVTTSGLHYEGGSGYATDGSVFVDYDTYIEDGNIFDLKLAAAASNASVCTVAATTRSKFYLTNNSQINHSTGRTLPDLYNPKRTWTTGAAIFAEPSASYSSKTYDPPSIAAGGIATTTVTVAQSYIGDMVAAAFSNNLGGLLLFASVTSDGTVTCTFFNPTPGAIDLASGTLAVKILT